MTQINKYPAASPVEALEGVDRFNELLDSRFFKALAEPNRIRLLCCLSGCGRACSLSEIAECCQVDLSVVSRHMSQLADVGIVTAEKVGRTVYYTSNYSELADTFRQMADLFENWAPKGEGECCG